MHKSKRIIVAYIAIAVGLSAALLVSAYRNKNSRPRSSPTTLASGGLYVEDARCAECHPTQASQFATTGHANTFQMSMASELAGQLHGNTFTDPERGNTFQYHFDNQHGLVVTSSQNSAEPFPLTYQLGSGRHAVTFLTLLPSRLGETVGLEHRISIFNKDRSGTMDLTTPHSLKKLSGNQPAWELDLTPSHRTVPQQQLVEHFGRIMQGDKLHRCVECHTTSAEITRQGIVNLRANVGCQNCHGPGREHVISREIGLSAPYSNFRGQSALSEVKLCGRCHRLPNDDDARESDPDDVRLVRFQSVGLLQSDCFQKGGEKLKCTTCHAPHRPVLQDANHYQRKCLECHGQSSTKNCSQSPASGCIECHMPRVDIHRGIQFHDHWIRVRK